MNERIKLLYKQAQEFAYKNISKEYWNTDNFHAVVSGKFAELIVRECAEVIFETPVKYTEIDIMHIIRDRVKEHFGVEE